MDRASAAAEDERSISSRAGGAFADFLPAKEIGRTGKRRSKERGEERQKEKPY